MRKGTNKYTLNFKCEECGVDLPILIAGLRTISIPPCLKCEHNRRNEPPTNTNIWRNICVFNRAVELRGQLSGKQMRRRLADEFGVSTVAKVRDILTWMDDKITSHMEINAIKDHVGVKKCEKG